MGRTVIRSEFEEQRKNQQLTLIFLVLGMVWVAGLGYWAVMVHASLFAAFMATVADTLPVWFTDAQVLSLSFGGAGCAVALWMLLSWILYLRSNDALPGIMGAAEARGKDGSRLQRLLARVLLAAGESNSPKLYVWEGGGPNAFAAGRNPAHGSIVVARSLLDILTDDELEAVLGHELAHLKNRDSLVVVQAVALAAMIVLMGYISAGLVGLLIFVCTAAILLAVSLLGEVLDGDGGWFVLLVGLAGICYLIFVGVALVMTVAAILGLVILVVGLGIGMVASALSQSREFLADAWSAAWTGRPELMVSVLKKTAVAKDEPPSVKGALLQPLMLKDRNAGIRRNSVAGWLGVVLRTHPSLDQRIVVLQEMAGETEIGSSRTSPAVHFSLDWGWFAAICITAAFLAGTVYSSSNVASNITILLAKRPASYKPVLPSRGNQGFEIRQVAEDMARLRSSPHTQGKIVAKLVRCTSVEVLEVQRSRGQDGEVWVKVRVQNAPHLQGWLAERLLSSAGAGSGVLMPPTLKSSGGILKC